MPQKITRKRHSQSDESISRTMAVTINNNKKSRKILKELAHQLRELAGESDPKSPIRRKLSNIEDDLMKAMILISIAEQTCEAHGSQMIKRGRYATHPHIE